MLDKMCVIFSENNELKKDQTENRKTCIGLNYTGNNTNKSFANKLTFQKTVNFALNEKKMIQRPQSIFLFFAVLSIVIIMYKVPVLALGKEVKMLTDFVWGQTAAWVSVSIGIFSVLQFKNRTKQLIFNQLSKFSLSVSFFIVYIGKGELLPAKGLFLFVLPYILLIVANRFIKKDEELVKSADRIR